MRQIQFISLPLLLCLGLCAQTTLSGNIGALTLDSAGSPYTVTDNIIINQGKTLTIGPGCVLLFKPYCGIDVSGELIVQGTAEKPVVFTSINDDKWNRSEKIPEAFDWNGIRILAGGRGLMARFLISYSVYGIQAQSEDIMISEGVFNQNGQFNFTLLGKILSVKENLPFNFDGSKEGGGSASKNAARPLRVASVCLGVTGVGCAISTIPIILDARQANRESNAVLAQFEINAARNREKTAITTASIISGMAGAFVATAVVLWVKDKRKHEVNPAVTLAPSVGRGMAAMRVAVNF
jgi:hypothetical protein